MSSKALHSSWQKELDAEFSKSYMQELISFLRQEEIQHKKIYPPPALRFAALNQTPFDEVKCVILGQDPYHGPHQAHGLSFSVPAEVKLPPSLVNIFKELKSDLQTEVSIGGDLTKWAQQGVLLLNSVLTVEDGRAGSHQNKGWEKFTDKIISSLNEEREGLVYILWGAYAQKKGALIHREKNLVLESVHPSPLSSYRGFFDSKPFSKTNAYLVAQGRTPIQWV